MTQTELENLTKSILDTVEREREREIVSRRYGLYDRKETLEQIGELLGITRERVRQLEKATMTQLRHMAETGELTQLDEAQKVITENMIKMGEATRITSLSEALCGANPTKLDQSRLSFIIELCPNLTLITEDDNFFQSAVITKTHDQKSVAKNINTFIDALKKLGEPATIGVIAKEAKHTGSIENAQGLATTSKKLATLHNKWGLIKWPTVNPKNIRDKIYVILQQNGKHMHFSEIAGAIKDSEFKRKNVTTQAIHNELIKDKRFILIGRGIYALKEWGYKKGTVSDIITEILKQSKEPLHRDEIVKKVLKSRYVKETTILLNLQGKKQFKRVAKATYTLAEGK